VLGARFNAVRTTIEARVKTVEGSRNRDMCTSVFVGILGVAVGMCVSAIVPAILARGYDPSEFSEVVAAAAAELNRKRTS